MNNTKYCAREKLIATIRQSGISTAKIAQMSGVSKGMIENWLYGGFMPTLENAERIYEALGYEIKICKKEGEQ